MNRFLKVFFVVLLVLFAVKEVKAEAIDANITLRSGPTIIFSGNISFGDTETIEIDGHMVPGNSVLSLLHTADLAREEWEISDLQYFDSFGSFLLNCITSTVGNDCYDWHYAVDGSLPSESIDKKILSGGENVYMYFGPQSRISLNASSIVDTDTLLVTVEKYDYENDSWVPDTEAIVGITIPNESSPYDPPTEVMTGSVDTNGQVNFSSIPVGTYEVGTRDNFGYYFPTKSLTVTEHTSSSSSGGGSGSRSNRTTKEERAGEKQIFDIKKAFDFLTSQQKEDGSFGEALYTDWVAFALASGKNNIGDIQSVFKLIKYFGENTLEKASLTDYERNSMALMSLGLDPQTTNGENKIEKIVSYFDGKQFGEENQINDDVFALIVLKNTGYEKNDEIIQKTLSFVLEKQEENGSWVDSVDMTSATIQALSAFDEDEQIKQALKGAKKFLKNRQQENGGWGDNASSTAWVLSGILALGEKNEDWKHEKTALSPLDYLGSLQDTDGGIKASDENTNTESRIWETAYVVSALSGKTWNQIMQKFEKEKIETIVKEKKTEKKITEPKNDAQKEKTPRIEADTLPANVVSTENTEPKENWFSRILGKIFSVF